MTARKRVAILISGRGSNMTALVEAARDPAYPAEIVGVFSNRADAPGLQYAWLAGIPTAVRSHKDFASREAFDAEIQSILEGWNAELVCLAGFMRIFSTSFATRWTGKMLNIHPSVLPKFKGLHPQQQALDAGARMSGCTVHWVVPDLDAGPTIRVERVPVLPGDTAETLAARILVEEHKAYPAALKRVALGDAMLSADGTATILRHRLHRPDGSVEEPFLSVPHSPDAFSYATKDEFDQIAARLDAATDLHGPLMAFAARLNADKAGEISEADVDHSVPEVIGDVRAVVETVIDREGTSMLAVPVGLEYMHRKGWLIRSARNAR